MSFFQNSVLQKHLKAQDEKAMLSAYEKFVAYFHDAARQEEIRNSQKEQIQECHLKKTMRY